jgi:hypothetical protein
VTGAADVRAAAGFAARHPALAVQCPHCRAPAGEPCIGPASKRRLPAPHPSRISAAEQAQPTATILPFQPRETP